MSFSCLIVRSKVIVLLHRIKLLGYANQMFFYKKQLEIWISRGRGIIYPVNYVVGKVKKQNQSVSM